MVVPHVLSFPGAIIAGAPVLGLSRQTPGWLFILWVGGYALLCLVAVLLAARGGREIRHDPARLRRDIAVSVCAVAVLVVLCTSMGTFLVDHLPPVMRGSSWTPLNRFSIVLTLVMLAAGIVVILWKLRDPLFHWLALALTAMAFANLLSEMGGGRFTVGWSAGRVSWLISSCVLFLYFLQQQALQRGLLRSRER